MSTMHIQPSHPSPFLGLALRELAENWWLLLLRGIAAIGFGVLAFIWPDLTLLTLTYMWGFYAIADGVLALWAAIAGKGGEIAPRWWLAVVGVAGIFVGALQIWGAIRLRKEIENEWLLGLSGLLSIAFGVVMFAQPGAGALAVVWLIGWFALLAGCVYIALAFQLKKHKRQA